MKQIKKIIFVLLAFCLVTSLSAQGKLLKTFTADLKSASKEFSGDELFKAQEKIFAEFVNKNGCPVVVSDGKGNYEVTFLYFAPSLEDGTLPVVTINCDSHSEISGTELKNIKNSPVFYKTVKLKTDKNFLTYMIKEGDGRQMNDPANDFKQCDRKKSSFVRLSDKVGGLKIFKFESKYEWMGARDIYVYLPAEYCNNAYSDNLKKFPVLYMLDGQNVWDHKNLPWQGWKVESSMERLVQEGKIQSAIVVGISNNRNRTKEYAGWCDELPDGDVVTDSAEFKRYANEHRLMIVEEIIPFIEANFNVIQDRSGRVIAGSSYGAFCSAYFAASNPEVFSGAGLFSGGSTGFEQIIAKDGFNFSSDNKVKFYIDCGTGDALEMILLPGTQHLRDYILSKGYKQAEKPSDDGDLFYQESVGHSHNEQAWSRRIPDFLEFMYK